VFRTLPESRADGGAPRRAVARLFARAAVLAVLCSSSLSAQDSQDETVRELLRQLEAERAARQALEARVLQLEQRGEEGFDDLERRLQGLVAPVELEPAPPRAPTSPAFYNPAVGVFMDARIDAGNFDTRLDEDTDDFSLRETEIDFRLPIAPFAEGVAILAFENAGNNEFESLVEEGYAGLDLGALLDNGWDATARLGRFRPMFGRNNQLHLHDWLQVNQPLPVRNLLGEEGVVGEGLALRQPLFAWESEDGVAQASSLDVAIVDGELLTGEEGLLGELAEDAGLALDSDGQLLVARASHYIAMDEGRSDLELGLSRIDRLGSDAVQTDTGANVKTEYWDADVTWRSRPAEHGVGSWLVQAEMIRADLDDEGAGLVGDERESGWWLTVQRQIAANLYLGLLYGESDVLGDPAEDTSISPYLSWYADEFFRIRAQLEHLSRDGNGSGEDFSDANRALLQFTWNFGAHQPHPYWVNR
jgi:hypothetical protein